MAASLIEFMAQTQTFERCDMVLANEIMTQMSKMSAFKTALEIESTIKFFFGFFFLLQILTFSSKEERKRCFCVDEEIAAKLICDQTFDT